MNRPDAASVDAMSQVVFEDLGYSVDDGTLQVLVDQAIGYIEWVSGRFLDENLPITLDVLATQAVRMRTEQIAFQSQPDYIETATDDAVASFSAGSYSETRRDQTRRGEQKALNAWGALSELLWMLMTDDKWDYWTGFLSGVHGPAFAVTEIAWSSFGGGRIEADVPYLVEPRGSLYDGPVSFPGAVDLNAWSW